VTVNQVALTFFAVSVLAFAVGGVVGRWWQFDAWKPVVSIGMSLMLGIGGGSVSYVASNAIDAALKDAQSGAFNVIISISPAVVFGLVVSGLGALIAGMAWWQTVRISGQARNESAAAIADDVSTREGALGRCPNCTQVILQSSVECPNCKAVFGGGSAWKVEPL